MMAEIDQDFEGDHGSTTTTTSFSQLLFGVGVDNDDDVVDLDLRQSFNYICSSFPAHGKTPNMLCFGDRHQTDHAEVMFGESAIIATKNATSLQKSGLACSDSSSASSDNNSKSVRAPSKSNRKKNGARESMQCMGAIVTTQPASHTINKKSKVVENPAASSGHAKVRKEKLGERITSLQQLVSPFGKTDTASVLHEAMGYIRFLHDQLQVLSSPYLQHLPEGGVEESRKDLKSRGLCLVPVACALHVENSNGADFWSPAAMGNNEIKQ